MPQVVYIYRIAEVLVGTAGSPSAGSDLRLKKNHDAKLHQVLGAASSILDTSVLYPAFPHISSSQVLLLVQEPHAWVARAQLGGFFGVFLVRDLEYQEQG